MYFPNPSLNENDLAIIERANTASRAYSAGQYVSWHGRTGRVKADILQGVTLSDSLFDYDEDGILNASMTSTLLKHATTQGWSTYTVPDLSKYDLLRFSVVTGNDGELYGTDMTYDLFKTHSTDPKSIGGVAGNYGFTYFAYYVTDTSVALYANPSAGYTVKMYGIKR